MSSLIKDSSITLFTRGLLFLISMGTSIIISRTLGPSLKGTYSVLLLIITVTSLLVLFGLGSANVYYGARNPNQLAILAGNSFIAAFGLGLTGIIAIELTTLLPVFQNYLLENNIPVQWVRWLILILPIIQLNAYLKEILRSAGNMMYYNMVALWRALITFVGVIIFVVILDQGIGGAIGSWILSTGAVSILIIWWVLKIIQKKIRFDWGALRRNFVFGVRLYPGNIAQFLNYRLDVFLVGLFLTPSEVGFYVTATALAEKLWEIPHAISIVLLHHVASAENSKSANATTARVSRIITFAVGGMCLLIVAMSYPLIYLLYGTAYLPAIPALIALIPGIWFLGIGKLLATHLSASGHPEIGTIGAVISLTITLILDILLIPRVGIIGAAIASSVSYMLSTIVFLIAFSRITTLKITDVIVMRRDDLILLHRAFGKVLSHRYL